MGTSATGSKRLSLRFNAGGYSARYKTEFEDGIGEIENISAGGCALRNINVNLALHERILLVIALDSSDEEVEIGAQVVRVDDTGVAVQFTDISEDTKQKIVKFFASIQRRKSNSDSS